MTKKNSILPDLREAISNMKEVTIEGCVVADCQVPAKWAGEPKEVQDEVKSRKQLQREISDLDQKIRQMHNDYLNNNREGARIRTQTIDKTAERNALITQWRNTPTEKEKKGALHALRESEKTPFPRTEFRENRTEKLEKGKKGEISGGHGLNEKIEGVRQTRYETILERFASVDKRLIGIEHLFARIPSHCNLEHAFNTCKGDIETSIQSSRSFIDKRTERILNRIGDLEDAAIAFRKMLVLIFASVVLFTWTGIMIYSSGQNEIKSILNAMPAVSSDIKK